MCISELLRLISQICIEYRTLAFLADLKCSKNKTQQKKQEEEKEIKNSVKENLK